MDETIKSSQQNMANITDCTREENKKLGRVLSRESEYISAEKNDALLNMGKSQFKFSISESSDRSKNDEPVLKVEETTLLPTPSLTQSIHTNLDAANSSASKSSWMLQANQMLLQRMARYSEEDRQRLQEEIESCRKALAEKGLIHRPLNNDGFFKSRMRRLGHSAKSSKKPTSALSSLASASSTATNSTKVRPTRHPFSMSTSALNASSSSSTPFGSYFWQYSKQPLRQSILNMSSAQMEKTVMKMYNSVIFYVLNADSVKNRTDALHVLQSTLRKCQDNSELCDEVFMQLIKQTTDSPDPNGATNLAFWQVLSLCCAIVYPTEEMILKYLKTHLYKSSLDTTTDEGRFATFCQKCLSRCLEKPRRKCPPAILEIKAIVNRRPTNIDVHLMNGDTKSVDFHSHSTVGEILRITRTKVGCNSLTGWAIIENMGRKEKYSNPSDYVGDIIHKWEIYARHHSTNHEDLRFIFRKRLFIYPYVNEEDLIEVELVAHQLAAEVFDAVIRLDPTTAIHLCALRALIENVEAESAMRILPRTMRSEVTVAQVEAEIIRIEADSYRCQLHSCSSQALAPRKQHSYAIEFIETCQLGQNFGAILFEAEQKFQSNWPNKVTLAISEAGLKILHQTDLTQEELRSITYAEIATFSTESRLTLLVCTTNYQRMLFSSRKTPQIVFLLRDYMLELNYLREDSIPSRNLSPKDNDQQDDFEMTSSSCGGSTIDKGVRQTRPYSPDLATGHKLQSTNRRKFRTFSENMTKAEIHNTTDPQVSRSCASDHANAWPQSLISHKHESSGSRSPSVEMSKSPLQPTNNGHTSLSSNRPNSLPCSNRRSWDHNKTLNMSSKVAAIHSERRMASPPTRVEKLIEDKLRSRLAESSTSGRPEIDRILSYVDQQTIENSFPVYSSTTTSPPCTSSLDTGTDDSIDQPCHFPTTFSTQISGRGFGNDQARGNACQPSSNVRITILSPSPASNSSDIVNPSQITDSQNSISLKSHLQHSSQHSLDTNTNSSLLPVANVHYRRSLSDSIPGPSEVTPPLNDTKPSQTTAVHSKVISHNSLSSHPVQRRETFL